MSRFTGNKSAAPRKEGNPLLTGILIGILVGTAMSAGVAWIIMKSPSPFLNKGQSGAEKQQLLDVAPVLPPETAQQAAAASGAAGEKPRFEFYQVLTDKQDGAAEKPGRVAGPTPATPPVAQSAPPPADDETYYLQLGSFSNADEAEQLKAKLTLMDMGVTVQTVTLPGKGVWHRVRVGPYRGLDAMNAARRTLKQNGIEATPMRKQ